MIADPTFDPFLPIITGMEQTDPSPAENFEMESVLWYCPRHSSWGYQLSILLSMWQLGPFVSLEYVAARPFRISSTLELEILRASKGAGGGL